MFLGFSLALAFASIWTGIVFVIPADQYGKAFGVIVSLYNAGFTVVPLAVGAMRAYCIHQHSATPRATSSHKSSWLSSASSPSSSQCSSTLKTTTLVDESTRVSMSRPRKCTYSFGTEDLVSTPPASFNATMAALSCNETDKKKRGKTEYPRNTQIISMLLVVLLPSVHTRVLMRGRPGDDAVVPILLHLRRVHLLPVALDLEMVARHLRLCLHSRLRLAHHHHRRVHQGAYSVNHFARLYFRLRLMKTQLLSKQIREVLIPAFDSLIRIVSGDATLAR